MKTDEFHIERINDTLNPPEPKFGMPWYVILGILFVSVIAILIPGCRLMGLFFFPCALGFGRWLMKDDPKEWLLLWYDLMLPDGFDPGK